MSCLERKNGRFPYEPSVLCSTLAKKATAAESNCSADDFLLLPFPFRKKRKGGRFLFLKKRNKRHCGGGFLSEKRMFPAHPTQLYRKTDGFHMNRPFCVTHWRKQQERRKKAAPQLTFFCFLFFLERKGRPPISAAVQWRGSRPRSPPYRRSPPRPRCNGPYDPSE